MLNALDFTASNVEFFLTGHLEQWHPTTAEVQQYFRVHGANWLHDAWGSIQTISSNTSTHSRQAVFRTFIKDCLEYGGQEVAWELIKDLADTRLPDRCVAAVIDAVCSIGSPFAIGFLFRLISSDVDSPVKWYCLCAVDRICKLAPRSLRESLSLRLTDLVIAGCIADEPSKRLAFASIKRYGMRVKWFAGDYPVPGNQYTNFNLAELATHLRTDEALVFLGALLCSEQELFETYRVIKSARNSMTWVQRRRVSQVIESRRVETRGSFIKKGFKAIVSYDERTRLIERERAIRCYTSITPITEQGLY